MAWEPRDGRGRYYTRSKKVSGRVVREYVGKGPLAELASAADVRRRAERRAQTEQRNAERENWAAADALLKQWSLNVDLLVRAALLGAGYRQHDRGAWRQRNDTRNRALSESESSHIGPAEPAHRPILFRMPFPSCQSP